MKIYNVVGYAIIAAYAAACMAFAPPAIGPWAGLHGDTRAAVPAMARAGQRFAPATEDARLHDRLHRSVYLPMYGRLAPLYAGLTRILRPRVDGAGAAA